MRVNLPFGSAAINTNNNTTAIEQAIAVINFESKFNKKLDIKSDIKRPLQL